MDNRFGEYKQLRAEHPLYPAKCVLEQIKRGRVQYVKEQLRGWSFDAVTDLSSGQTTRIDTPDGGAIRVTLHHTETPSDILEDMCDVEGVRRWDEVHTGVVSHVTGVYVIRSGGYMLRVTMKYGMETPYYSRNGQSKQVAFELAVSGRRDQLDYVEAVLRGDVYHVGLTVLVLDPNGKKVGEDSLWGIELSANDSADYLKEVAEEMYFELVGGRLYN